MYFCQMQFVTDFQLECTGGMKICTYIILAISTQKVQLLVMWELSRCVTVDIQYL